MCPMTARPLVAPRRTCYFTDELHFYNRFLHLLYPFFHLQIAIGSVQQENHDIVGC